MELRFSSLRLAPLLALIALAPACSKDQPAPGTASSSPSTRAAAAPTSAPTAVATVAAGKPSGAPLSLEELEKVKLPIPSQAPKSAKWETYAVSSETGFKLANLKNGKEYWVGIKILDCRKSSVSCDPKNQDYQEMCCAPPATKWHGYPAVPSPDDTTDFKIRVGNMYISAGSGVDEKGKPRVPVSVIKKFLEDLDLGGIAKM
jgi:hypothetical protein